MKKEPHRKNQDPISYGDAAVRIVAANSFITDIVKLDSSRHPASLTPPQSFASLYELPSSYQNPVLVTTTDGVGTKIELAIKYKKDWVLGIDLVAMCVNDLLCYGATPLVFLDYYATGRIEPLRAKEVIRGINQGCIEAGCQLAGGETAEMPGFYADHQYDLAGFVAGLVEKNAIIYPSAEDGSQVIGLASSGVHANGFSLIRRLLAEGRLDPQQTCGDRPLIDALLQPTKIYANAIKRLQENHISLQGIAHITGGGLMGNLIRSRPPRHTVNLALTLSDMPPLFQLLKQAAAISHEELYHTFNCGIGMAIIVAPKFVQPVLDLLQDHQPRIIGEITKEKPLITNTKYSSSMNIAVLISGRGSNMLALNEAINQKRLPNVNLSLVLSSRADAKGLAEAKRLGLPTKLVDRSQFNSQQDFEAALIKAIECQPIDLIVLAGFMHILSADFISHFTDKIINIHPSLLPKYKRLHTHKRALEAGEILHGLTIHMVNDIVDGGPIIMQKTIAIPPDATANSLADIVLKEEHRFLPLAVRLLANQQIILESKNVWFNNDQLRRKYQLHRRGIQWDEQDHAGMTIDYDDKTMIGGYSKLPIVYYMVREAGKPITESEMQQVEAIHQLLKDSERWLLEKERKPVI